MYWSCGSLRCAGSEHSEDKLRTGLFGPECHGQAPAHRARNTGSRFSTKALLLRTEHRDCAKPPLNNLISIFDYLRKVTDPKAQATAGGCYIASKHNPVAERNYWMSWRAYCPICTVSIVKVIETSRRRSSCFINTGMS